MEVKVEGCVERPVALPAVVEPENVATGAGVGGVAPVLVVMSVVFDALVADAAASAAALPGPLYGVLTGTGVSIAATPAVAEPCAAPCALAAAGPLDDVVVVLSDAAAAAVVVDDASETIVGPAAGAARDPYCTAAAPDGPVVEPLFPVAPATTSRSSTVGTSLTSPRTSIDVS